MHCLRPLLPLSSSSSRSSSPFLTSGSGGSSRVGGVHPVTLNGSRLRGGCSSAAVHPVIGSGRASGAVIAKASILLDDIVGRVCLAATDSVARKTALVTDDLAPVLGCATVTREVTKLIAVVACDVDGRPGLGALARHVALCVAVTAGDNSRIRAVALVVASLAAVEAGACHLLGSGALLRHVTKFTAVVASVGVNVLVVLDGIAIAKGFSSFDDGLDLGQRKSVSLAAVMGSSVLGREGLLAGFAAVVGRLDVLAARVGMGREDVGHGVDEKEVG